MAEQRVLDISTGHVSQKTRDMLDRCAVTDWPCAGFVGPYGYTIYAHDENSGLGDNLIPDDLWHVLRTAHAFGYDYVMFDRDGDQVGWLPWYEDGNFPWFGDDKAAFEGMPEDLLLRIDGDAETRMTAVAAFNLPLQENALLAVDPHSYDPEKVFGTRVLDNGSAESDATAGTMSTESPYARLHREIKEKLTTNEIQELRRDLEDPAQTYEFVSIEVHNFLDVVKEDLAERGLDRHDPEVFATVAKALSAASEGDPGTAVEAVYDKATASVMRALDERWPDAAPGM